MRRHSQGREGPKTEVNRQITHYADTLQRIRQAYAQLYLAERRTLKVLSGILLPNNVRFETISAVIKCLEMKQTKEQK